MGKYLTKLTPAERVDMQMQGLSPNNDQDVIRYKKGLTLTESEKKQRIEILVGDKITAASNEPEMDMNTLVKRNPEEIQSLFENNEDYRKLMKEEVKQNYKPTGKVFKTDDLLSLKKNNNTQQQIPGPNINLEKAKQQGFEDGKKYLNAFIINLQTNSNNTRVELYKTLNKVLTNYKNLSEKKNVLAAYNQGVIQAEKAMLENLS